MAKFIRIVYDHLEIKANPSTAYHTQTNGLTERTNQEVTTVLHHYCTHHPVSWSEWVPIVEFALNNLSHGTTRHSPFYLDYARHPLNLPDDIPKRLDIPTADSFVEEAQQVQREAIEYIQKEARAMDKGPSGTTAWGPGTKVWLATINLILQEE